MHCKNRLEDAIESFPGPTGNVATKEAGQSPTLEPGGAGWQESPHPLLMLSATPATRGKPGIVSVPPLGRITDSCQDRVLALKFAYRNQRV